MKLLLDTHILLWWMSDDAALPENARNLIRDPENAIFVSPVTLCEVWLKVSIGKLRLGPKFEEKLAAEGFQNLPLTWDAAREVARLEWHHRDPFDRMLIAQAVTSGVRLLTADETLSSYGGAVLAAGSDKNSSSTARLNRRP